jgi:hypothetical protein
MVVDLCGTTGYNNFTTMFNLCCTPTYMGGLGVIPSTGIINKVYSNVILDDGIKLSSVDYDPM